MLPYYLLLLAVGAAGTLLCVRSENRLRDLIFLCSAGMILVALAWVRAPTVGVDTQAYRDYFAAVSGQSFSYLFSAENIYRNEPGYALLNLLLARVVQNPTVALGVISAWIIGLRMVAIWRQSASVWISVYIYIGFGFFGYAMCTLRQELAISIFLLALPFLKRKRFLPYLLIVLLAATFHNSLLAALPLCLMVYWPLNNKIMAVYAVGTLLLLLFSEPILELVTRYMYQSYQLGSYYLQARDVNTALIPLVVFVVAFLFKKPLLERDSSNQVLLNLCAFAAFLFVVTVRHFIFQRFALVLFPVVLFLIPELVCCARPDPARQKELEDMRAGGRKQKQQLVALSALRVELRAATSQYYTAVGFVLVTGLLYCAFLLNANRLLLVPYVTIL